MFTGIVEERGIVRKVASHRLVVECLSVREDSPVGSSLAVNGACLTVAARDERSLEFDLSEETLSRTSLGRLRPGDPVNLERPLMLASRLGGHLMQGHVDGLGEIVALEAEAAGGATVRIAVPARLRRYVVEKGSIAVDGVSLTVAGMDDGGISIALIPHTLAATTLGEAAAGHPVNLEVDVVAKYVERLMEER